MAIDFDMMSVVAYCLPDAKHNKKDFDRDFNRFVVKQDNYDDEIENSEFDFDV